MTKGVEPEAIDAILAYFSEGEGAVLVEEPSMIEALRVTIRVALQVQAGLNVMGDSPELYSDLLFSLRIDIGSSLEFFEEVARTASSLVNIPKTNWPWREALTWNFLREEFDKQFGVLRAEPTCLVERYAALVRLGRLQFVLWGMTLGSGTDWYVA